MKRGYKFGGWTRHKTKAGYRYFYKGKPKSAKAFSNAERKYAFKRVSDGKTKETTRQRWGKKAGKRLPQRLKKKSSKQQPSQKTFKIGSVEHFGKLCTHRERERFYKQVLADRKVLQGKLSDESYSALRVVIEMSGKKTKNKGDTGHNGKRSFRDLRNLKNFLDVSDYGRSEVDWDETTGMCKYKKSAKLVMVKLRGDRVTGEKIYRRYTFDE